MGLNWENFSPEVLYSNQVQYFNELGKGLKERYDVIHAYDPHGYIFHLNYSWMVDHLYQLNRNFFSDFDTLLTDIFMNGLVDGVPAFVRPTGYYLTDGTEKPGPYVIDATIVGNIKAPNYVDVYNWDWDTVLIDAGYAGGKNDKIDISNDRLDAIDNSLVYEWAIQRKAILELLTRTVSHPPSSHVYFKSLYQQQVNGDPDGAWADFQTWLREDWNDYVPAFYSKSSVSYTALMNTADEMGLSVNRIDISTAATAVNRDDSWFALTGWSSTTNMTFYPINEITHYPSVYSSSIASELSEKNYSGQDDYVAEIYPQDDFYDLPNPYYLDLPPSGGYQRGYTTGSALIARVQNFAVEGGFQYFNDI